MNVCLDIFYDTAMFFDNFCWVMFLKFPWASQMFSIFSTSSEHALHLKKKIFLMKLGRKAIVFSDFLTKR
jgi:hypothetical protein